MRLTYLLCLLPLAAAIPTVRREVQDPTLQTVVSSQNIPNPLLTAPTTGGEAKLSLGVGQNPADEKYNAVPAEQAAATVPESSREDAPSPESQGGEAHVTTGACPQIHVFGARETTAPPGFGTAGQVVDKILAANRGATSEAIVYPAAPGAAYGKSVQSGTYAVTAQVKAFAAKCPKTKLVMIGYSQGAQIMENSICGGGDVNQGLTDTAVQLVNPQIMAVILMGDPRHVSGLPYNKGTAVLPGFDPRPVGFKCPVSSIIQAYCDAEDPYCSKGNDPLSHQQYGRKYGEAALTFVQKRLGLEEKNNM